MTNLTAPLVDPRSAEIISREVRELLRVYAPGWSEYDPTTGEPAGLSAALIGIYSRFAEIIIERLNRTPEKNLLAFLDLLGMSLLPPQPARVPVTFSLAAGSSGDATVPTGTQAAAPPPPGSKEPLIFETERELTVTAAQLVSVYARTPATDAYADHSLIARGTVGPGAALFTGNLPITHAFYVRQDELLGHPALKRLRLVWQLVQEIQQPDARLLHWDIWDGAGGLGQTPTTDETASLTKNGRVIFDNPPPAPAQQVGGLSGRWLRCLLQTPITQATVPVQGMVRASSLPQVRTLQLEADLERLALPVEAALGNAAPLDTSKNFLPFGDRPRLGDTLYLAHSMAFASAGATVTLHCDASVASTSPATASALRLRWEFWNGAAWTLLGTSQPDADGTGAGFLDTTRAFTRTGDVTLNFPQSPQRTTVAGVENYWVRARISAGDYGRDATYTLRTANPADGYVLTPATYAPPTINSLSLDFRATLSNRTPDAIITDNDFVQRAVALSSFSFAPFQPTPDATDTLYFGLTLPAGRTRFPNRAVSLYLSVVGRLYGAQPDNPAASAPPLLAWDYWDGAAWSKLAVADETEAFTRAGLVEFVAPDAFVPHAEFGQTCYWVRARRVSGDYLFAPRVARALLNTAMASQVTTVRDEVLGSSDASAALRFRTTRAPVLAGPRLLVREQDLPAAAERARTEEEEGADAVTVKLDAAGRPAEVWVRWHEVSDFYGSGPRDRHYVLDHQTGEIRFGDGLNGMIPPRGASNIRLALYRSGGGAAGNVAAGTIKELKTTIPYVDAVVNPEPALGGADMEAYDSLLERAPRAIRHRERAVTVEDYEDLAKLASPRVARSKGLPLYDLAADPDATTRRPGTLSVVIVPATDEARPVPDLQLIETVGAYLEDRRATGARLVVVGPDYVRVDVTVEVVPVSREGLSELEASVAAALGHFLHPLTGGSGGTGWGFGRKPHRSDLFTLIEALPGVDYVRRLSVAAANERTGQAVAIDTGPPDTRAATKDRFLVYSGTHRITFNVEGA